MALTENKKKSFKCLLKSGANINNISTQFGSSIHYICSKLNRKYLELIISHSDFANELNILNFDRNNPLHILFTNFNKNTEEAKLIANILLNHNVNCNQKNAENYTPLHLATLKNQKYAINFSIDNW